MKTIYYTLLIAVILFHNCILAQNFTTTPIANPFGINYNPSDGVLQPTFIDLDGDGDQDLLIGRSNSSNRKLDFYENIGTITNPNFTSPIILITGAISNAPYNNWVFLPTFGDIDNDGDYDLLVGRGDYSTNNFEFYENIGSASSPSFLAPIFQQINDAHDPVYVDFDNDGDLDLFTGEKPDYTNPTVQVQFHENIGTSSNANYNYVGNIANVSGNGAAYISVGDLDLDGNKDIVLCANDYELLIFKSDSSGTFTNNGILIPNLTDAQQKPSLVDIDNDGDLDLFIGSETGLMYYENTQTSASVNGINLQSTKIFPNPTSDFLHYDIENIKSYKIIDVSGKKIQSSNAIINKTINISSIKKGLYFLVLKGENNRIYTSKIIIN